VDLFSKDFIRKQIIEEYNGYNIKQLAVKYGYTERWIKKILQEHLESQNND
jgi:Mor family transcriptional regulator